MPVLLSAGMPDPKQDSAYFRPARAARVREAVIQLARAVLPTTELVFGGHPAVAPLVLAVARQMGAIHRVIIFQSEFFRSTVPPESLVFSRLTWTSSIRGDRSRSLEAMRSAMVRSMDFEAAFFIGGMQGGEDELRILRRERPQVPVYPVASTGGAAEVIFSRGEGPHDAVLRHLLERDLVYGHLFQKLLGLAP